MARDGARATLAAATTERPRGAFVSIVVVLQVPGRAGRGQQAAATHNFMKPPTTCLAGDAVQRLRHGHEGRAGGQRGSDNREHPEEGL